MAIDEDTSSKAGKGFSHFFGLNDLVDSTSFTTYETGLRGIDAHGFTAGGQISMRLSQPDGRPIRDVTVTVPAALTMNDLVTALNSGATGVGLYGAFTLDTAGRLTFQGTSPMDAELSIVTDNTQRGAGGPSISQLFGLGVQERSARAGRFQLASGIAADPTRLAFGQLDLTVGFGPPTLRPGDGRGALALANSGDINTGFQAAGGLGALNMSVSRYASEFGGSIGRAAAAAQTRRDAAASVATEATARRQSVEGVNLDEELISLTT